MHTPLMANLEIYTDVPAKVCSFFLFEIPCISRENTWVHCGFRGSLLLVVVSH